MSAEDNGKPATQTKKVCCPISHGIEVKAERQRMQLLLLQDYEVR
jgi:hypothetical protein